MPDAGYAREVVKHIATVIEGFWIYHLQNFQRTSHPQQIVDGIVSPAHGANYSGNNHWTIVMLNALANERSAGEYAAFVKSGGTT